MALIAALVGPPRPRCALGEVCREECRGACVRDCEHERQAVASALVMPRDRSCVPGAALVCQDCGRVELREEKPPPVPQLCLFCGGNDCEQCKRPPSPSARALRRRKFAAGVVPAWATSGTYRQQLHAANGRHPLGLPLARNGRTCGECVHVVRKRAGSRWVHKCALSKQTNGAATDTRARWPACTGYQPEGTP